MKILHNSQKISNTLNLSFAILAVIYIYAIDRDVIFTVLELANGPKSFLTFQGMTREIVENIYKGTRQIARPTARLTARSNALARVRSIKSLISP